MTPTSKNSLIRSAGLVGAFTLLAKIIGVLRASLFVSTFGASDLSDAYVAAFRIPDFVASLLILGTLSVALIPVFTEYYVKDREEANKVVNSVMTISFLSMLALCLVLFFAAPIFVRLIAPGFSAEKLATTIHLTRIFLLSPIIFMVSNVFSSLLNAQKKFFLVALAPIIYNLGIIFGIYFLYPLFGIDGVALGVIIGALGHLLVQVPGAIGNGFKFSPQLNWKHPALRKIFKLFLPRTLGVDNTQISLLIATIIGSSLATGTISIFNYANDLQALPLSMFGISFAVVDFPSLAEAFAKNDEEQFSAILARTMADILYFVVPFSILFILIRSPIVRVIYGHGHFDWTSTKNTANALGIFSISIAAQALTPLFSRSFFARHKSMTPFFITLISMAVSAVLAYYLGRHGGILGLALAFTIANIINMLILYIALYHVLPDFHDSYIIDFIVKICFATGVMALVTYVSLYILSALFKLESTLNVFLYGLGAGVIAAVTYLIVTSLMGIEQADHIVDIVKRRIFR